MSAIRGLSALGTAALLALVGGVTTLLLTLQLAPTARPGVLLLAFVLGGGLLGLPGYLVAALRASRGEAAERG